MSQRLLFVSFILALTAMGCGGDDSTQEGTADGTEGAGAGGTVDASESVPDGASEENQAPADTPPPGPGDTICLGMISRVGKGTSFSDCGSSLQTSCLCNLSLMRSLQNWRRMRLY